MSCGLVAAALLTCLGGTAAAQPASPTPIAGVTAPVVVELVRDGAVWTADYRLPRPHEGAHFWLGQAVRYERTGDAWITEGGADLLAIRAVQALDPSYDWRAELSRSIRDCAALSAGRAIASAEERGEHRAYCACGAVFALVAEAMSGRPFSGFVRDLIHANRVDRIVTRDEWLDALDATTRDPTTRADIDTMLETGSPRPGRAIAALLHRAGVPSRIGDDGLPDLL